MLILVFMITYFKHIHYSKCVALSIIVLPSLSAFERAMSDNVGIESALKLWLTEMSLF